MATSGSKRVLIWLNLVHTILKGEKTRLLYISANEAPELSCNASHRHTPEEPYHAASVTFLGSDIVGWISAFFRLWLSLIISFITKHPTSTSKCGMASQFLPMTHGHTYGSLAAINVSPHLSFNHAVHRHPQFLLFHPRPLWPRQLPSLPDSPE